MVLVFLASAVSFEASVSVTVIDTFSLPNNRWHASATICHSSPPVATITGRGAIQWAPPWQPITSSNFTFHWLILLSFLFCYSFRLASFRASSVLMALQINYLRENAFAMDVPALNGWVSTWAMLKMRVATWFPAVSCGKEQLHY